MIIFDELKKHINKEHPIRENVNFFKYICEQNLDTRKVFAFFEAMITEDFHDKTIFTFGLGIQLTDNLQQWTIRVEFTYVPEQILFLLEDHYMSENMEDFFKTLKKSRPFLFIEKNDIKPVRVDFIEVPM